MIASQRSRSSVSSRTLRRRGKCSWSAVSSSMTAYFSGPGVVLKRYIGRATMRQGLARGAAARHICAMLAPTSAEPPVAVERLVKVYKTVTAVDGISFALAPGSFTGAARRQRRRQDHHHRHDHGPGRADLWPRQVLGAEMPRQRHRCCTG